MIREDIEKLPDRVQSGQTSWEQVAKELVVFIMHNKPMFGLQKYDEDFMSDFIIQFLSRGPKALSEYCDSKGGFVSYLYLLNKYRKNIKKFNEKVRTVNEPIVSDKDIIRKLFIYAIPFIMIDVTRSLYNYIDMFSVVKGLVEYAKYSADDAEIIYSMLSTWGQKFNMILLAISSGIVVSMIPNLTESIVKKDEKEINKKVSLSLDILLFLMIPMSIGISFLSKSIWTLFYGASEFGPKLLCYYIFVGLAIGLFTCLITILQTLKDYKNVLICLVSGVVVKFIMNMSLLRTFYSIGLPPYYGIISATILGFLTSIVMCIIILHNKYKISFESVLKHFVDIICGSIIMIIALFILKFFVPICSDVRIVNVLIIILYAFVGAVVYFAYSIALVSLTTLTLITPG